jgi:hypothetical protein
MTKVFRNSNGSPIDPDYVPNYKKMNVVPIGMQPSLHSQFVISRGSTNNPRERAAPQTRTVPFAEVVIEDNFPIGMGPVPNVGNNIEHTWAGVDGDIIDDLGLDANQPMIDNNDYVEELPPVTQRKIEASYQQQHDEDLIAYQSMNAIDTKQLSEYSLLIFGEFYSSGTLEDIQKEVTDILYNQHALSKHSTITLDDITVLKKMSIKFGVFINEE